MLTMLGIGNCDTVRKARKFLEANNVDFVFRDLRKNPLSAAEWDALLAQDADAKLVNTRGPSFRKSGVAKQDLDPNTSRQLLLEHPTAMKRPVMIEDGKLRSIGFSEDVFAVYQ